MGIKVLLPHPNGNDIAMTISKPVESRMFKLILNFISEKQLRTTS
jgi:hypothetical protein